MASAHFIARHILYEVKKKSEIISLTVYPSMLSVSGSKEYRTSNRRPDSYREMNNEVF